MVRMCPSGWCIASLLPWQGVLTALMGASGAGKTTLMDVLAGRKTGEQFEAGIAGSKDCQNYARDLLVGQIEIED